MTSFSNCDVLFPNCDVLFPNCDEFFPNCDELFLIVTSYSVCDFYRETEIINKNHVIIVKAHTNTTLRNERSTITNNDQFHKCKCCTVQILIHQMRISTKLCLSNAIAENLEI
jgi:hypothetical protein